MMTATFPVGPLLFLIAACFMQVSESAPVIEVQPSQINYYGLTGSLEVNCSITANENFNMAALCSMIISRSNDSGQSFTDLAGITDFSPNKINLATTENVVTAGIVDRMRESYLHLRWENPAAGQAGIYRCSVQGIDSFGHAVVSSDTAEVSVDEPDFSHFADIIVEIQDYTSGLLKTVLQMGNDLKVFEQTVQGLNNYTQSLETQISNMDTYTKELEDKISQLDSYARNLEVTASQATTSKQTGLLSYMFEPDSLYYNNHTYYVSKNGFSDIDVAMWACTQVDGYLVEINDANELHVVKDFLGSSSSSFAFMLIAGSDRATEGQFILPSTQRSIPYAEWGPGNPATGTNEEDCLGLYSGYQWKMYDEYCHFSPPKYDRRYMCEIPYK